MLHDNLSINKEGHLCFAGLDTVLLAKKYGTPLFLIDEDRVRKNARTYINAMRKYFGGDSGPLLASKALCFSEMYRIAASEGMRTDIVSPGELYIAHKSGFPMGRAFFHGNNKTDEDIAYAIECGIGYFVADNREELEEINRVAAKKGIKQKIILRLSPGIDPHTHAKISTGKVDSKFGSAIETGQADEMVQLSLSLENIALDGFHCHIGSQIFECEPFCDAADIMLSYVAHVKESFGFEAKTLNLGGGFGVRYVEEDPYIDYAENIKKIASHVNAKCEALKINKPTVLMEPGRSIVADAGMTLYTVGTVKTITGYKTYVSIDGGMTDNPRYALYQSKYTFEIANKASEEKVLDCTVAGRCCESGDLLGEDVKLQNAERGDILATLVTGAYNYSMSSNYNKIPRPPVVMISGGVDRVAVRRETYADLARLDV
ncbi:MAG: diaminopimelate decarboxylase [Clostridia bacterium]|nr:diaminopimelate decarboxylase [Clostridia bacterium]